MTLLYLEFLEKCMPVRRGSGSAMIPEVSILDRSCPRLASIARDRSYGLQGIQARDPLFVH
jgi:hypothetical protein